MQNELSDLDAQAAALDLDIREKGDQIEGLRTEKELQSGGEVRELTAEVDEISKRWVVGLWGAAYALGDRAGWGLGNWAQCQVAVSPVLGCSRAAA